MLNIDVWDIVWTVVNLLLFFVLLRIFLFKPVMKVMDEREQMIRDDLDSAQAAKEESEALKAKYETELAGAKDQERGTGKRCKGKGRDHFAGTLRGGRAYCRCQENY